MSKTARLNLHLPNIRGGWLWNAQQGVPERGGCNGFEGLPEGFQREVAVMVLKDCPKAPSVSSAKSPKT